MSSEPMVVQAGPVKPSLAEALKTEFKAVLMLDGDARADWLAEHAESVDYVVTAYNTGVGPELMAALPNWKGGHHLRCRLRPTAIDTEQARERGIAASNTGVLTEAVSGPGGRAVDRHPARRQPGGSFRPGAGRCGSRRDLPTDS